MSEMYEGVVFRGAERAARSAFGVVASPLRLRLVRLAPGVYGVYRVMSRADPFDPPATEGVARSIAGKVGRAVAFFYDNSCGVRVAVLYSGRRRVREFGDEDAWWVPYGDNGELLTNGPRCRENEMRPDVEYDCVFSAIDAGLEAARARPRVTGELLKDAFCYERLATLAASKPRPG